MTKSANSSTPFQFLMPDRPWMIYGANGYTGRMIAERVAQLLAESGQGGAKPILAGRNQAEIEELGQRLGFPTRVFACNVSHEIAKNIQDVDLVLHCAGPFSATASPMVKACMQAQTHYLDITGEISVFEKILNRRSEIAKAGIVAVPGVGFDVVPSDCLAAQLNKQLPGASELELILRPSGGFSPGTLKTMLEGFYVGTVVRKDAKIEILNRFVTTERKFKEQMKTVVGIAWGDISTAYHSTGIGNIQIFLLTKKESIRFLQRLQVFRFVWKIPAVQALLKTLVEWGVAGPDTGERAKSGYQIWGTVRAPDGTTRSAGIETENGYTFTVDAALACVQMVLNQPLAPGAYTPSGAFGAEFVYSLPGVRQLQSDH